MRRKRHTIHTIYFIVPQLIILHFVDSAKNVRLSFLIIRLKQKLLLALTLNLENTFHPIISLKEINGTRFLHIWTLGTTNIASPCSAVVIWPNSNHLMITIAISAQMIIRFAIILMVLQNCYFIILRCLPFFCTFHNIICMFI